MDSPHAGPLHTLYLLTFASGKNYVGQTVRALNVRLAEHRRAAKRGSQLPVHAAWRKHGEPTARVLGQYGTHAELHCAEIDAIARMNTVRPAGYNLAIGGQTAPGLNPDVAQRIGLALRGRVVSAETRARMSASAKAKTVSDDTKAKISAAFKGKAYGPQSEERRRKAGDGVRAAWADPVKRVRLLAARQAAWATRRQQQEAVQ